MKTQNKTPDANRIDDYRRQMLEMYRQSSPPLTVQEDNWLDVRYPEPNIEQDKQAIASPLPAPQPTSIPDTSTSTPTPDAPAYVGYLRVYAFTGGGAEPISGARVVVTRADNGDRSVYANLTTDRDGFTPVISLPSVDPALTLRPGVSQPYIAYTVRVTADGFQPVEHRNIPVYGNNYVTQPVTMTPVLPGRDADNTKEFTSGGPANL